MAVAAFDQIIKKPPSRFGDTMSKTKRLKNPSKKAIKEEERSAIKLVNSGSVHFDVESKEGADEEESDVDSQGEGKIETNWFN